MLEISMELPTTLGVGTSVVESLGTDWCTVAESGAYQAYARELEFIWRWIIIRDEVVVQEGCSLSFVSTQHAVRQVFAFYSVADARNAQEV